MGSLYETEKHAQYVIEPLLTGKGLREERFVEEGRGVSTSEVSESILSVCTEDLLLRTVRGVELLSDSPPWLQLS